ncbi:hypothetical protein [Clostridium tetani]|uniref:hypothetical protein n=1 Tax=Clostridium tetani TaxID=1513 RepID=UPI00100C16CE|nr:hypothetical protein [Clostridium tetani]RXM58889.1 hypothetical protein DP133_02480 [Clostridium tetani]RXM79312.1 hypothetical protein DP154_00445 [Clostridium tetani]RYV00124.1 hypothetical protein DP144_00445 [Clostridium tetani]
MKIQQHSNFVNIFNLHKNPQKTKADQIKIDIARKENPQLDRALYLNDINKVFEEKAKVEQIAKKIARGKQLTREEKELISRTDPEMLRKAEMAKQENDALKRSLKSAKSKQHAQRILAQACIKAQLVSEVDPQYADLLMDTIQELHKDINKGNNPYDKANQYTQNKKSPYEMLNLKR